MVESQARSTGGISNNTEKVRAKLIAAALQKCNKSTFGKLRLAELAKLSLRYQLPTKADGRLLKKDVLIKGLLSRLKTSNNGPQARLVGTPRSAVSGSAHSSPETPSSPVLSSSFGGSNAGSRFPVGSAAGFGSGFGVAGFNDPGLLGTASHWQLRTRQQPVSVSSDERTAWLMDGGAPPAAQREAASPQIQNPNGQLGPGRPHSRRYGYGWY